MSSLPGLFLSLTLNESKGVEIKAKKGFGRGAYDAKVQRVRKAHAFVIEKNGNERTQRELRKENEEKRQREEEESLERVLSIELERDELQDLKEKSQREFNQARKSVKQTFGKEVTLNNYKQIQGQFVKNDDERSVIETFVKVVSELRQIKQALKAFNLEHGTTSQ